jgi:hypothetical protein
LASCAMGRAHALELGPATRRASGASRIVCGADDVEALTDAQKIGTILNN